MLSIRNINALNEKTLNKKALEIAAAAYKENPSWFINLDDKQMGSVKNIYNLLNQERRGRRLISDSNLITRELSNLGFDLSINEIRSILLTFKPNGALSFFPFLVILANPIFPHDLRTTDVTVKSAKYLKREKITKSSIALFKAFLAPDIYLNMRHGKGKKNQLIYDMKKPEYDDETLNKILKSRIVHRLNNQRINQHINQSPFSSNMSNREDIFQRALIRENQIRRENLYGPPKTLGNSFQSTFKFPFKPMEEKRTTLLFPSSSNMKKVDNPENHNSRPAFNLFGKINEQPLKPFHIRTKIPPTIGSAKYLPYDIKKFPDNSDGGATISPILKSVLTSSTYKVNFPSASGPIRSKPLITSPGSHHLSPSPSDSASPTKYLSSPTNFLRSPASPSSPQTSKQTVTLASTLFQNLSSSAPSRSKPISSRFLPYTSVRSPAATSPSSATGAKYAPRKFPQATSRSVNPFKTNHK